MKIFLCVFQKIEQRGNNMKVLLAAFHLALITLIYCILSGVALTLSSALENTW